MGITLNPREYFVIVRQLADHTDSSTYYVRAVVRNSRTDAVLSTINLDSQGNGRFTKEYQVPADVSGLGYYIDIVTSVYSDSGYTTKAATYGDESETYLIDNRMRNQGGGGVDVDYKKIEKMIQKAIEGIEMPQVEQKEVDLSPLSKAISTLHTELKSIKIPEYEKVEIKPVLDKLDVISREISSIEFPEQESLDLSPVMELLENGKIKEYKDSVDELNKLFGELSKNVNDSMPEIKGSVSEIQEKMKEFLYMISKNSKENSEKETEDTKRMERISRLLN
jgi:methyl-accepting chemotaxis protein